MVCDIHQVIEISLEVTIKILEDTKKDNNDIQSQRYFLNKKKKKDICMYIIVT